MRVAFNARLLDVPSLRGWNRYTVNLLAELPAHGVELYLYAQRPLHESHLARLPAGSYRIRLAPPMRYLRWEQSWLPRQCDADRIEVLHCPFNFGLPWSSPCPQVLTLHDAIHQVYYGPQASWGEVLAPAALCTRLYHWSARVRAHQVITVSGHAKGDLVRHLGLRADKIAVIYLAADSRFHQPVSAAERCRVQRVYALPSSYVFYVGGWEKRKNIPFLVRAFAAARLPGVELVLAGGKEQERAALVRLAESLGVAARVRLLGWVEDTDLPALFAAALGFVYPSEYEGFGLQVCEALAIGCPTLAARATSLPEVLGKGGDTFPLDDPCHLTSLLRRLAEDAAYRSDLTARARLRAGEFSWRETARQTLAVYQRAKTR